MEITWPARGPKLSVAHTDVYYLGYFYNFTYSFVSISDSVFILDYFTAFMLYESSFFVYYFSIYTFFYSSTFSTLEATTAFIFSMMKITPIICSFAIGPEAHANQKPFLMAVINSAGVVLYSSSKDVS